MDTQKAERARRRRNLLLAILLLVLLVVLVKGWLVGRHAYALGKHAMRLRTLTHDLGALLQPEEAARIKADLGGIEEALRGLRTQLRPVLRPVWLPWRAVRENLLAADELLRVGAELAQAGQVASDGLRSVVGAVEAGSTSTGSQEVPGMSEKLFWGLVAARPYFEETEQQVGRSCEDVSALVASNLWTPFSSIVADLERYLRLGRAALGAAAVAPTLLGESEPVHYMILAQNNDELRATGGFITGIGLVTMDRGKISNLTFKDSYAYDEFTVDHPFAPDPMQRYMGIILWTTRDGNWSPDFPTAVQNVEDLYHLENSTEISGVVAFDISALQALVQAIGPVELGEYQVHVDGNNVLQKIHEYWAPEATDGMTLEERKAASVKWLRHRKDFMGVLAQALMARLLGQSRPDQLSGLLWVVKRAIDEKHIQLHFHESAVQELLARAGMDGALDHSAQGDYLLALDVNMGYNKVNPNVEKHIEYEVALGNGTAALANLTITYDNHSPAQPSCEHYSKHAPTYELMTQDCYWNYLRIYVPLGSELLAVEGVTETQTSPDEEGKTVFATFFVVPANESRTIRFTYSIPDSGLEGYSLLVQKQAGTDAVPVKVRIILPQGVRVLSAQPEPQSRQQGVVSYDLDLRRDRSLVLKLR